MGTCPECDADIEVADDDLDEMEVGDPWDCESCGSRLRVASLDPLEFDIDDDDDDDDEDGDSDDEDKDSDDSDDYSDDYGDDGDGEDDDWDN